MTLSPEELERARPEATASRVVQCVLLQARGAAATPPELVDALRRRGVIVETISAPCMAMAELLRHARSEPVRARRVGLALVVVEPDTHHTAAEELLRSLARFVPGVACWRYDHDASPRLRAFTPSSPESASAQTTPPVQTDPGAPMRVNGPASPSTPAHGPIPAHTRPGSPPRLRLTSDHDDDPDDRDAPRPAQTHSAQSLLTEEELNMLLGGDERT